MDKWFKSDSNKDAPEVKETAIVIVDDEEETAAPAEFTGEVTRCACDHCGLVAVEYHDGKPYSVGGDTSKQALKEHGII